MNEAGIAGADLFITKAQLLSSRWTISFDYDIGLFGELQENSSTIRLFDIEGDAPFIGVEVEKVEALLRMRRIVFEWRNAPRFVAARRFDFHDVGAHVGEELGAVKTQRTSEVQYSIAGQRRQLISFCHDVFLLEKFIVDFTVQLLRIGECCQDTLGKLFQLD